MPKAYFKTDRREMGWELAALHLYVFAVLIYYFLEAFPDEEIDIDRLRVGWPHGIVVWYAAVGHGKEGGPRR